MGHRKLLRAPAHFVHFRPEFTWRRYSIAFTKESPAKRKSGKGKDKTISRLSSGLELG